MWIKLSIDSKSIIDKYTKNKFCINDYSFTNLLLWSKGENIEYKEEDEILIIRGYYNGVEYYYMPLALEENQETVEKIRKEIEKIVSQGHPIGYFTEYWKEKFKDSFTFKENRNYFDYIYSVEELSKLSGRKFVKKRNRVNKFMKTYDYKYEKVTDKNITEVIEFQKKWLEEHNILPDEKEILYNEFYGIIYLLENFSKLDIKVGLIKVGNKIVAYAIGEQLTEDTAVIHIEKALHEYAGSYQMINLLFLQNEFSSFKYVNREDDFGDEGIREAKLSYNPIGLLKKYDIT